MTPKEFSAAARTIAPARAPIGRGALLELMQKFPD